MTSMVMRLKMTRLAPASPKSPAPDGQTAFHFAEDAVPEQAAFTFDVSAADRYEARAHSTKPGKWQLFDREEGFICSGAILLADQTSAETVAATRSAFDRSLKAQRG